MAIENIKVELLFPHPNNPRLDVGDVTELADSIKSNGILQNLTVVSGGKGVPDDKGGYTVIIGHRRLQAAKQAGLMEIPCVVADMDDNTQVSTMLLENMQRSDLTAYEQAQGFQMMFDMGETVKSISEKTGFSETTVRHRMKLMELDQSILKQTEERTPTMSDYIELEKIEDIELRNSVLEKIGTKDFAWALSSALSKEQRIKNKAKWVELFQEVGINKCDDYSSRKHHMQFYCENEITDDKKEELRNLVKNNEIYYAEDQWGYFNIVGERKEDETEDEISERKKELLELENKRKILSEIEKQMSDMRVKFVKDFHGLRKRHFSLLLAEFIGKFTNGMYYTIDFDKLANLLDITIECNEDSKNKNEILIKNSLFKKYLEEKPQKILLACLSTINERMGMSLYTYNCEYSKNIVLENWYGILKKCGYEISTEEEELLNGTHEIFNSSANLDETTKKVA